MEYCYPLLSSDIQNACINNNAEKKVRINLCHAEDSQLTSNLIFQAFQCMEYCCPVLSFDKEYAYIDRKDKNAEKMLKKSLMSLEV